MIKIGRCTYDKSGKRIDPKIPGFANILVLMKSSLYWELSPYYLKDDNNVIMENKWQFSKVYEYVPRSLQKYSRYDKMVIWDHPEEIHVDKKGNLTKKYWEWRKKGMKNKEAVRYPVGYHHRKNCMYAIKENNDGTFSDKLDYITARKEIYIPEYCKLVKKEKKFIELKKRYEQGENILIIEVDGPHQESLPYYIGRYGVNKDFIINETVDATEDNIKILLNDPRHNFGHGYCLAMALLAVDDKWIKGNAPTFSIKPEKLPETVKNRVITSMSKRKIKSDTTKTSTSDKKKEFNEKMEKLKKNYTPLTTTKENVVPVEEYDLMEDLNKIIDSSSLIKKNIEK